ncbi:MBL fold metallo-hydrolase [Kitasatospora sp. NPDC049285]|uniref:MBL fold metallo-hydrolase n=1 Tax=Kitasatospora sp. NPDC049285 TaxID=3157096 RepID=UPI0034350247
MTVHHLDCATFCPYGGRLLVGSGGRVVGRMVGHCLLVERADGLVLVDTGFGTADVADPLRLGRGLLLAARPQLTLRRTALHQVRALGFDPRDVRDIVVTHLDPDHAGGLGDFPEARVHVLAAELRAARDPATRLERSRYRAVQWSHGPRWTEYAAGGEQWFGFEAVRLLPGAGPEVLLVPLTGHTHGHSGVAVRDGERWLLHCGDAYFSAADLAPELLRRPPALRTYQQLMAVDDKARQRNQQRLRELRRDHGDLVRPLCAHDAEDFTHLAAGRG